MDVLNVEIPDILRSMRSNIEESESLISRLRAGLGLREDEGVWGRPTETERGTGRTTSTGRNSRSRSWHLGDERITGASSSRGTQQGGFDDLVVGDYFRDGEVGEDTDRGGGQDTRQNRSATTAT